MKIDAESTNIKGILFLILEILQLILKCVYYICEGTYRLFVPRKKKSVVGEVVLITGAGNGIGRELAIGYASLGATVICWDINEKTNNQTMNKIKQMGKNSVYAYRCDVSDRDDVFKMAEKVKNEVGNVTVLINNAGIAPIQKFLSYEASEISKIININFISHCWTVQAFLPNMIEKDHGHVVAIASQAILYGCTHGTIYCPTKAAVRIFMEALHDEIVRTCSKGKSSVKFTTVHPSVVTTNLFTYAKIRFPSIVGIYSPQQAASLIIDAQRRDYKEKFFHRYHELMGMILRLLPDKMQTAIIDFLNMSFDSYVNN